MTRVYLTIVEKTSERHRNLAILHNGWQWYLSTTNDEKQMLDLLNFFECNIEFDHESCSNENGKMTFYNISKDIISKCGGGFWNLEQLQELANGRRLKNFLGLSNGALVSCYAAFDDEKNTVEILRPNPNAKEVYFRMPLSAEIEYRKKHWIV